MDGASHMPHYFYSQKYFDTDNYHTLIFTANNKCHITVNGSRDGTLYSVLLFFWT
jgi:hypothetical protein